MSTRVALTSLGVNGSRVTYEVKVPVLRAAVGLLAQYIFTNGIHRDKYIP